VQAGLKPEFFSGSELLIRTLRFLISINYRKNLRRAQMMRSKAATANIKTVQMPEGSVDPSTLKKGDIVFLFSKEPSTSSPNV
jgi:hypothetical protein